MGKVGCWAVVILACAGLRADGDGPAGARSGGPASSTAASRASASSSATLPAEAGPPPADKARIDALVGQLSSDRYQQRRLAYGELERIINLPGVAETLRANLKDQASPESRAVLEELLGGYDQPLVVLWCTGRRAQVGNSWMHVGRDAGYPWLFVSGEGQFLYDASSTFLTGKMDEPAAKDIRCGRLTARQLWRLKEMIARSGLAREPTRSPVAVPQTAAVQVAFYLRSVNLRRVAACWWSAEQLSSTRPAEEKGEWALARDIRDFLAACPAGAFEGTFFVYAQVLNRPMPREELAKLPEWPVAGVNLLTGFQPGALPVSGEQLKAVREALAKTDTYRFQQFVGCQVTLIPLVKDARETVFGPGR